MKLLRVSVCIVLLCVFLCGSAAAETKLEELYAYSADCTSVDLLVESDLLVVKQDAEYALATLDGKLLSAPDYNELRERYGWLVAESAVEKGCIPGDNQSLSLVGVMAKDGTLVVPTIYNYLTVENEHWAIGYQLEKTDSSDADVRFYVFWGNNVNANITAIDIYNLDSAQKVATLERAAFSAFRVFDSYMNVQAPSGAVTAYDAAFTPVDQAAVRSAYDFSYVPGYENQDAPDERPLPESFRDEETWLYGIRDAEGNTVLPAEYKYTSVNSFYGQDITVFCIQKDDAYLYGLISAQGRIVLDPVYSYVSVYWNEAGYAEISLKQDDVTKVGVIDKTGAFLLPAEFDRLYLGDNQMGYAQKDDAYTVFSYASGPLDVEGLTSDICHISLNGASLLVDFTDESELADTIINTDGTEFTLENYKYVSDIGNTNGLLYGTTNDEYRHSVITSHGETVLDGYNALNANKAGTLLLVQNDDTYLYSLFEIK